MLPALLSIALAVSPADHRKAVKLAHRSLLEYNAGELEQALGDALAAYHLDPLPVLLFNLGQCYRRLDRWERALFVYQNYLIASPNAKNRATVEKLIAQMQAKLRPPAANPTATAAVIAPAPAPVPAPATRTAAKAPALAHAAALAAPSRSTPATPPAPAAAVTAPARPRKTPPSVWWFGGAGLATGAAGTVLGLLASSTLAGDRPGVTSAGTWHTVAAGPYRTGRTEGLSADVLWGLGGALVLTAAIIELAR